MDPFCIKRGDTSPMLEYEISPDSIVLTGASVVFNMTHRDSGQIKVSRMPAVILQETSTVVGGRTVGPKVGFNWAAADTDTSGLYDAEFEVTYADGKIETIPNSYHLPIKIKGDLA